MGRIARPFWPTLSMRGAESARLRTVHVPGRSCAVPHPPPGRRRGRAHRMPGRKTGRSVNRPRLGRGACLGHRRATPRLVAPAGHHQFAAPGHLPARAANQSGAAVGQRLHEFPLSTRRGTTARGKRLRAPLAAVYPHGRQRPGARWRQLADRRQARAIPRRLAGRADRRLQLLSSLAPAPPPRRRIRRCSSSCSRPSASRRAGPPW